MASSRCFYEPESTNCPFCSTWWSTKEVLIQHMAVCVGPLSQRLQELAVSQVCLLLKHISVIFAIVCLGDHRFCFFRSRKHVLGVCCKVDTSGRAVTELMQKMGIFVSQLALKIFQLLVPISLK